MAPRGALVPCSRSLSQHPDALSKSSDGGAVVVACSELSQWRNYRCLQMSDRRIGTVDACLSAYQQAD